MRRRLHGLDLVVDQKVKEAMIIELVDQNA